MFETILYIFLEGYRLLIFKLLIIVMEKIQIWRGSEVKEYEITTDIKKLISQNSLYQLLRFNPSSFYLLLSMVGENKKPFYTEPELQERIKKHLDPKVDDIQKEVSGGLETLTDIGIVESDWKNIDGQDRRVYSIIEK
jgi:predicted secreted protein